MAVPSAKGYDTDHIVGVKEYLEKIDNALYEIIKKYFGVEKFEAWKQKKQF